MGNIFKSIGKGLLYVLFFPLGLIAIILYAVFGVFVFFFQFIRLIFLFFSGRSFKTDLQEDIEAKKLLEKDKPAKESEAPLSLYPSDSIVYGSSYVSPTMPEEKSEETPVEESKVEIEEEEKDDY